MANTRKHKGEPKLPFNFVVRALFLLLRGGLLLFLVTVALYRCFCRSPSGIKSKRIFLSADLLSSWGSDADCRYLEVVLLFCARPRGEPLKSVSTPKKSVSCVSAVLFLLCQSRYVLFLLGVSQFLLFLYQRYSRCRANF